MQEERSVSQAMVAHATWLLPAAGTTLQWNGGSAAYRDVGLSTVSAPASPSSFRVKESLAAASRARPYWTTGEICLVPTLPAQTIEWDRAAARLTFSLTPILLADTVRGVIPRATGELVWAPWQEQTASPTPSVHPVLLGHAPYESLQVERITIVPTLPVQDPLHRHIVLVLQAAVAAESEAERLYAEALVEALVVHFLRRYAASWPSPHAAAGGLTPYKLQHMLAYIRAHLEHELSLATLAAVAQMSITHFAHLFKDATGLPPHQYVILCRMEHAKRLLAETDMPLIEIGPQVGCMDQSHFT
ncbi:MAG TPA: AraC family transcriptional regulator, partial [Candidatus Tectomicrobia bacterium]